LALYQGDNSCSKYIQEQFNEKDDEIVLNTHIKKLFVFDYFTAADANALIANHILNIIYKRQQDRKEKKMKGFKFIVSEKFLKKLKCKIFTNMKNYMKNDKKICTLWRFRLSSIRESMSKDCKELAIYGHLIRQKEELC